MIFASILDGGCGSLIGATTLGYDVGWVVEPDLRTASVSHLVGATFPVILSAPCHVDYRTLPSPDMLHIGQPRNECDTDGVIRAIIDSDPASVTIEVHKGYLSGDSWGKLSQTLYACGYWVQVYDWDAMAFGVPRSRRRMYIIAIRGNAMELYHPSSPLQGWADIITPMLGASKQSRAEEPADGVIEQLCMVRTVPNPDQQTLSIRRANDPAFDVPAKRSSYSSYIYDPSRAIGYRCRAINEDMHKALHTLPDDYTTGKANVVASHIIGSTVPPTMFREFGRQITNVLNF